MRVSSYEGVRIGYVFSVLIRPEDHLPQVFQVDLVHDSRVWRDHPEVVKTLLSPPQKSVAFDISRQLELSVVTERLCRTEAVHLNRMVNDQVHRLKGVDDFRPATHPLHGVSHGGEINDCRDSRKVLHEHPSWHKSNLFVLLGLGIPTGKCLNIRLCDEFVVLEAQEVLEQHLDRERQSRDIFKSSLFETV